MSKEDRVTIDDCRRAGHCVSGVKAWVAEMGISFRDLMKDGIPIETVASKNNGYGDQVVAATKERIAKKDT